MTDLVLYDVTEDGVVTLTLNRPEKLNALNGDVFLALRTHLRSIRDDPELRCVVLTGAGASFCAGHDLATIGIGDEELAASTIDELERLPQPTVAKVRGHCLTGGLELALGCDLIVAERSASFADSHGRWGLAPLWGMSVRLPERIGVVRAKDLMLTGRRLDGAEAEGIGLLDRCADDGELDGAVEALVEQLLESSTGTHAIVKRLLATDLPRTDALLFERSKPFGDAPDHAERMAGASRYR